MTDLPIYVCRRTAEPVVVDGALSDPIWSRLEPVGDFRLADGSGKPQLPTELKLCWDDSNLYLGFTAIDTDIWGTMRQRDDSIYEEEVVEAFICSGGDITHYYEFEFSPHNVVFDAAIQCPESGDRRFLRADLNWNCEGLQSAVTVAGTLDDHTDVDDRWTVEVALPFSQIGLAAAPQARRQQRCDRRGERKRGREHLARDGWGRAPRDGETWRANFYRIDRAWGAAPSASPATMRPQGGAQATPGASCERRTGGPAAGPAGEFSCWSPTLADPPNFHVPGRFGRLVFSAKAA
jgi:hypothetical protein